MNRKLGISILLLICIVFSITGCKKNETEQTDYRMSQNEIEVDKGKTSSLMVLDESQSGKPFLTTWTSENPAVVTVADKGYITGVAAGVANVTVEISFENSDKKITLASIVTVLDSNAPLENIAFSSASIEVDLASSFSPEIIFYPENASNKKVTVTSDNEEVVSIDPETNMATANKLGTATLKAVSEDGGYETTQAVKVVKPVDEITSFKLDNTSLTLSVGEEGTLTPTIAPETVVATIEWSSSDDTIATVENGVVKALRKGKVTITATVQDKVTTKSAKCTVTVSDSGEGPNPDDDNSIPATKVTFDKTSLTVYVGDTGDYGFKATVTPANTTQKGQWTSSNSSIVSVDSNGKLTICKTLPENKNVSVTITYKVGSVSARGVVVVKPKDNPASALALNKSAITLKASETFQLVPTLIPDSAREGVSYSSSDDSIATVSDDGLITAVSSGTATITAKTDVSGHAATCTVTVQGKTNVSVSINLSSSEIAKGANATATVSFSPGISDSDMENISVSLSSSSSAVQISKSSQTKFTLTGEQVGSATISCSVSDSSGKYTFDGASVEVTVTGQEATGISLSQGTMSLQAGQQAQLSAGLQPSGADDSVEWFSSDEQIVSVSGNGLSATVTGKAGGTATITVRSKKNPSISASCTITVS